MRGIVKGKDHMKYFLMCVFIITFSSTGSASTITNYSSLEMVVKKAEKSKLISVSIAGRSIEGRNIFLVNLNHGEKQGKWKLFLYAQQHGNEPAGKEALLKLITDISLNPDLLPENVDLYIVPSVNPDGAEADKRRNANDYDLNRDHQRLSQPETVILHQIFRQIMPHMAVDCHEFGRDSEDYNIQGWTEWPLIMMDCSNSPVLGNDIYHASVKWIEDAIPFMKRENVNYTRYFVGNAPPEGELRYSTTEMDDGRNGFGAYGGISFIIESGVNRNNEIENLDLPDRVNAYSNLFKYLINNRNLQTKHLPLINDVRHRMVPDFLPVNYFWGNKEFQISYVKVIDKRLGEVREIPIANFVKDLIVKKTVSKPEGYIIPVQYAELYGNLLSRHEISYNILAKGKLFTVESCLLLELEENWDETYSRYGNRQIVEKLIASDKLFEKGSLYIPVTSYQAVLHLEPSMLYGLYQYPEFRAIVPDSSIIPVYRHIKQ